MLPWTYEEEDGRYDQPPTRDYIESNNTTAAIKEMLWVTQNL